MESCSGTIGALLLMLSWTSRQKEETARAAWLLHKQPYSAQYFTVFVIGEYAQPVAVPPSLQVHGKCRSVTSSAAEVMQFVMFLSFCLKCKYVAIIAGSKR
jgi:hypothetical protein